MELNFQASQELEHHQMSSLSLSLSLRIYLCFSYPSSLVSCLRTSFFRLAIVHHGYVKLVILILEIIGSYSSSAWS